MRELVMKYKAEKVYHEEMVKMPLVDLKVLEVYHKSKDEQESRLKMNLELLKKEKCYVKPNKAWWFCLRMLEALGVRDKECDIDGSRASTIHFQSKGLNMRQRRWIELFSDYGCETKYHMGKVNIVVDAWRKKGGVKPRRVRDICDVRTLIMEEAHAMKYSFCPEDEIGESKMIGLEIEQETTKVVVIKERLKEAKDRVVRFGKKGKLALGFFARLSEGNWNLLCIRHVCEDDMTYCETQMDLASQAGQSCVETCVTAGYDPSWMIVIIRTARLLSIIWVIISIDIGRKARSVVDFESRINTRLVELDSKFLNNPNDYVFKA
nr:putative reverse transcriptase domain-containing protein [Tanacetum cinerariifolium]